MIFQMPDCYFLVAGHADGYMPLNAFDNALLDAGVGDTNLVRLSSILPPGCRRVDPMPLPPGALIPIAYAGISSSIPGERIAAGIAVAVPKDPALPGLIMEYSSDGTKEDIERIVRRMAEEGFKSRHRELLEIRSLAVEHVVSDSGAAFAGIVLWSDRV